MSEARRFFDQLIGLSDGTGRTAPAEDTDTLDAWPGELQASVMATLPRPIGLADDQPLMPGCLASAVRLLPEILASCERHWDAQWDQQQPARQLAGHFDDMAMLLVFGKFNAGKSTFCNFLAERCALLGGSVRGFRLVFDQGLLSLQPVTDPLAVGATETTACIQGVVLAERLVLLDTPGLHSLSPEHAELTRCFTDSADGLLWLTSSASPGQVQELDELTRELQRDKPLLAVLTRSDSIDEDEIDGTLVRQLCNKPPSVRQQQEADVHDRARARLAQLGADPALLRSPISISVSTARAQGLTPGALTAAGFERLFASLRAMIAPALAYKVDKPAAVRLHHLQEQVLGSLDARLLPAIAALQARLAQESDRLAGVPERMAQAVWRRVVPRLPALLDQWVDGLSLASANQRLSQWLDEALASTANEHLAEFLREPIGPVQVRLPLAAESPGIVDVDRAYTALEDAVRQAFDHADPWVVSARACVDRLQLDLAATHEVIDDFRRRLDLARRSRRNCPPGNFSTQPQET